MHRLVLASRPGPDSCAKECTVAQCAQMSVSTSSISMRNHSTHLIRRFWASYLRLVFAFISAILTCSPLEHLSLFLLDWHYIFAKERGFIRQSPWLLDTRYVHRLLGCYVPTLLLQLFNNVHLIWALRASAG